MQEGRRDRTGGDCTLPPGVSTTPARAGRFWSTHWPKSAWLP